jgi:hypothetical protein
MHSPFDVGQPHVAAGVAEGEAFVVEAEQVQDRGVPVVDVQLVDHRFVTEVVGGSVLDTTLHSAAGHRGCESRVVVVATKQTAHKTPQPRLMSGNLLNNELLRIFTQDAFLLRC